MVAVNRERFVEAGAFDVEMPARQDYEAWLRVLNHGATVDKIDEVTVEIGVRLGDPSVSKSIDNNWTAISLINRRYATEIEALSSSQQRARQIATASFMVHKKVLNRARSGAFPARGRVLERAGN